MFLLVVITTAPRTADTHDYDKEKGGCGCPHHDPYQHRDTFHLLHLYLVTGPGAAVFVMLGATTIDISSVPLTGTVEASVPFTNIVNVSRTVF